MFVRSRHSRGIISWPDVEDRREEREGSRETVFMYKKRYLAAMECVVVHVCTGCECNTSCAQVENERTNTVYCLEEAVDRLQKRKAFDTCILAYRYKEVRKILRH